MPQPHEPLPAETEVGHEQVGRLKQAWRLRIRQARRERVAGLARDPEGYLLSRFRTAQNLTAGLLDAVAPTLARVAAESGCVAVYQALPTEPPTDHLVTTLLDLGAAVLVPQLLPDRDLAWRRIVPKSGSGPADPGVNPADPRAAGRPVLPPSAIGEAGLVVVPALAVDRFGGRLGQGGGSYDRALPRVRPGIPVVALVFDEEFTNQPVPTSAHDARVGAVLTPQSGFRWLPLTATDTGE